MMTIEQKAGALLIGPSLHMRRVVAADSPAFELLQQVVRRKWEFPRANMAIYLEDTKRSLFQMFDNGQASPKDMLRDGSTLLHVSAPQERETVDFLGDLYLPAAIRGYSRRNSGSPNVGRSSGVY